VVSGLGKQDISCRWVAHFKLTTSGCACVHICDRIWEKGP